MKPQKIIGLVAAGIIAAVGTLFAYNSISAGDEDIHVMNYKPAPQTQNSSSFRISRYENIQTLDWVNDREILTMSKKADYPKSINIKGRKPVIYNETSYYLGIYNPDTGISKDFKDVNMRIFLGMSPDKKYALYEEFKRIPPSDSGEWKEALKSGELYNHGIKLLNLSTGSISELKTKYKNKDAEYQWIENNKIVANYPFEGVWEIVDINGNIVKSGPVTSTPKECTYFSGTDIKSTGNDISGRIYFRLDKTVKNGTNTQIVTVDINTKEVKTLIKVNDYCNFAHSKGINMLLLFPQGGSPNATLQWLDDSGIVKNEFPIDPSTDIYNGVLSRISVSPNGKIAALPSHTSQFTGSVNKVKPEAGTNEPELVEDKLKKIVWTGKLTLLDLESGKTRDVINCGSVQNISWSSDGNTICFSSKRNIDSEATSYIVALN